MKSKSLSFIVIAVLSVAVVSCKKDKEEEALPSLYGKLRYTIPEFVSYDAGKISVTPSGVTHPEKKGIGYSWKVTPGMNKADTTKTESSNGNGSFAYDFGDSLGTYSITCTAFASGYYSTSSTAKVEVVKSGDNGSITEAFPENLKTFKDNRDGVVYRYASIGNLDWFSQNLEYSDNQTIGSAYKDEEVMNSIFGRYYTWDEASAACPQGWRLPSEADWAALAKEVGGSDEAAENETFKGLSGALMTNARFNGKLLWEFWPDVKITNKSGMSVLPTGFANTADGTKSFLGIYEYAAFWTSNQYDSEQACYRYIYCDKPDMFLGTGHKKSFAASVRCVRDKQ